MRSLRRLQGPMWEVVERHFQEAEFLAELWRDAFDEPGLTLVQLAEGLEAQLRTHLQALTLPGRAGAMRLLWPSLTERQPDISLSLVSSLVILMLDESASCEQLVGLLGESQAGDERWQGIVEALALCPRVGPVSQLVSMLEQSEGALAAGIAATLARRQVSLGSALTPLLRSSDRWVLLAAAQLARWADGRQLPLLAALSHHADPRVVAASVESALLRGVRGALEAARYWAFDAQECEFRRQALVWMALAGDEEDHRGLLRLVNDGALRSDALWAASFTGRIEAAEVAMGWLEDELVGPLAGEVLTTVAGLPTDDPSLWLERPVKPGGLPPLSSDPLDDDLTLRPEELLPAPEPQAIQAWWQGREAEFDAQVQYLWGGPLSHDSLMRHLSVGPLRQRHGLALMAELRMGGPMMLWTRDWACSQLSRLAELHPWRAPMQPRSNEGVSA